jgi:hypothetical protein
VESQLWLYQHVSHVSAHLWYKPVPAPFLIPMEIS